MKQQKSKVSAASPGKAKSTLKKSGPAASKKASAQAIHQGSKKSQDRSHSKNPQKVGHGGFRGKGQSLNPGKSAKGEQSLLLRFVTSSVNMAGCPIDSMPEIAIVGRSNAGKSSLINAMAQSRIAMVSSTPGKTRLLNFFQCPSYRLVDMPGYGYAARGSDEVNDWRKMVETFLATRTNLVGLFLIMDIRREWTMEEQNLLDWLSPRDLPCAIVLTKSDKISNNEITNAVVRMRKMAQRQAVFAVSSSKRTGLKDFEDYGYTNWVKDATK